MHRRCRDPNFNGRHNYGGRGIMVCDRWKSYEAFAEDMGPHPGKGWSLERKENDTGYCKDNCCWLLRAHQARNKRNNKLTVTSAAVIKRRRASGESGPSIARDFGITKQQVYHIALGQQWQ